MDPIILKEIGEELKRCRIAAKLPLTKVAKLLRIRKIYLEAIEDGNFKDLPSSTYIIGYVKQYAKMLGLNFNEIVKRLKDDNNKLKSVGAKDRITDKEFLPSSTVVVCSLIAALLLYILVQWFKFS